MRCSKPAYIQHGLRPDQAVLFLLSVKINRRMSNTNSKHLVKGGKKKKIRFAKGVVFLQHAKDEAMLIIRIT